MPARISYPQYHFPNRLSIDIFYAFVFGKHRSIKQDAVRAIKGIIPPVHIIGMENIPSSGPALITMNHYARSGFSIAWSALAVAAQLSENQAWLMTSAWTKRKFGLDTICTAVSKYVFSRLAKMYGAVTTPPFPPIPDEQYERSVSIRKLFRLLRTDPASILCIAPEGQNFNEGELGIPAAGTGKLIFQLEKQLGVIIPVGIWECFGRLVINFGTAYDFDKRTFGSGLDNEVSSLVMNKIAYLLPNKSRKNYF